MAGPLTFLTLFERRAFFGQKKPSPGKPWLELRAWLARSVFRSKWSRTPAAARCKSLPRFPKSARTAPQRSKDAALRSRYIRHRSAARMPHPLSPLDNVEPRSILKRHPPFPREQGCGRMLCASHQHPGQHCFQGVGGSVLSTLF